MLKISDQITIVIPTKNEEDYIGNLLLSIKEQRGVEGVRIIIADANSTDNTLDVIEDCRKAYDLNIEVIEGGPVSTGRNNGLKLVKTPYVFFIDADVIFFDNHTLVNTYQALHFKGYSLVTAKLKCYEGSNSVKWAYKVWNFVHSILVKKYPFAIGLYFCVDADDFRARGIFDEKSDNSEDFLSSQKYKPYEFTIIDNYVGQDDRRLKKMGIWGMTHHLTSNLIRYIFKGKGEFREKSGYWDD